jgi:hypothetical protein
MDRWRAGIPDLAMTAGYSFGNGDQHPSVGRTQIEIPIACGVTRRKCKSIACAQVVRWCRSICVLPDGRLASGSRDKTIRLWDTKTGVGSALVEGLPDEIEAENSGLIEASGARPIIRYLVAFFVTTSRSGGRRKAQRTYGTSRCE